jgi:hypothetical protein
MTDEVLTFCVQVLAIEDAPFYPCRDWAGNFAANSFAARGEIDGLGVNPPHSGGADSARKVSERRLAAAEDLELLVAYRPRGRVARCRLTEVGRATAREAAGLTSESDSLLIVVRELARCPYYRDGDSPLEWVSEVELTRPRHEWGQPGTKPYADVEIDLAPSIRRGWVESNSDGEGRAYYRVTSAGLAALADPPVFVKPAKTKCKPGDYWSAYDSALGVEYRRLISGDLIQPSELGSVPLSNSMGDPILRTSETDPGRPTKGNGRKRRTSITTASAAT